MFCSFLSLIALKRLMNTILAIIVAIYLGYDTLCLDRHGTHCLELFFGLIRGFSKGIDGWATFYRTVAKTLMSQDSLSQLKIDPSIKHRANLVGVVISEHLDESIFSNLSSDALTMAKDLFRFLETQKDDTNVFF